MAVDIRYTADKESNISRQRGIMLQCLFVQCVCDFLRGKSRANGAMDPQLLVEAWKDIGPVQAGYFLGVKN